MLNKKQIDSIFLSKKLKLLLLSPSYLKIFYLFIPPLLIKEELVVVVVVDEIDESES
jgi:hypothetical protein